jgi:PAS domain S-box-containing protein
VDGFSTLFELLPIGAYRSLPDGTQVRANPALVKLNGYASEAELLAGVKDIGTEWYVQAGRRDAFKHLLETEGRVTGFVSEVYRHCTRERIWIRENAHVVRDAEGRILYYEGTVEDITEQRRAELALQASEAQLREIAEQMPAVVYRVRFEPEGQPLRLLETRHP